MQIEQESDPIREDTIFVHFPDNSVHSFPSGIHVSSIISAEKFPASKTPIVACYINSELKQMNFKVNTNVRSILPVHLDTPLGSDIYRKTLAFVLEMAFQKVEPNRRLEIGHSLGAAYFFEAKSQDESPLSIESLNKIDDEMKSIISSSFPIIKTQITWKDAILYFTSKNMSRSLSFVTQKNTAMISVSSCNQFVSLCHGILLPNTNLLSRYELLKYGSENGFLLRFPHTSTPSIIDPFVDQPKIFSTFVESKKWGRTFNVSSVGDLNKLVLDNSVQKIRQYILLCETLHDRKMVEIATAATSNENCKLILIAGPSSSGKTTFARKLCVHLRVLGKDPFCLSLDDFYNELEDCPKDASGEYDFESLEALDVKLINETLSDLIALKEVQIPVYNFKTNKKERGKIVQLKPNSIIVVEGIHGLNDRLTPMIPAEQKYKIFISALTQLTLDELHRVPTTDNRLVRRMVRDYQFRGTSGEETILRWPAVRAGEEKHIFPFQNSADIIFNSALDYEMCALRTIAEPLLRRLLPSSPVYLEAQRILSFVRCFEPLETSHIPINSILREFIGGSSFADG
ncbi:Uridine kinase [Monocercomonoides exilis]|uniref:Uridine kinase n=1 Tax=Monocercomonoides exilis TaxID=2049356 RepID=UPI003559F1E9|nr:Uridine kinase [Monocercomonoides exilis]|eukprot:MONOS_7515.1-p1 / transcript=MONOS_7515.1 / gene=MONOS_7515 / organism=Monocercomonoides_exilis_PA203 / gene_product=Uridine kinase [EC:2.7.1.48] / transcript_product=Uridine kinase [EC:2.7.1.48] / location=Mono_scaffold00258:58903-60667(+) / protein_length=572 / sequence_SO=supercontig / SO=protein_coding / is_pseudo=false